MSSLSSALFNFKGQCVQSFLIDECTHSVLVRCRRERRFKVGNTRTGRECTVDHDVKRWVHDLPVSGRPCSIEVELAQTRNKDGRRLIESTEYIEKGARYTTCFCQFISGLCRYMNIHAVSQHLGISWETVKNIDKEYLAVNIHIVETANHTWIVKQTLTASLQDMINRIN